ncbi:hypothetical protein HYALB_00001550 [Hymenoscyphus albidus]|uniref:Uncharacterized protein n=1 Tax=Hymenoscyphus albidus TaxID=595503 RepID=A0A9N9LCN8_9HELO|nr:hypothetical protein HYALB_00001550 [Hymenoscyphus albidus]
MSPPLTQTSMDISGICRKPVELCILEEHVDILAHQIPQGKEFFSIIKASLRKVDEPPVGTARTEHWRFACQSYLRNVSKILSWVTFRRQILYREAQADLWNKTKSFDHTFTKSRIPRAVIQTQKETVSLALQATAQKERDDPELTLVHESQSKVPPGSDSTNIVPDGLTEVQSSNRITKFEDDNATRPSEDAIYEKENVWAKVNMKAGSEVESWEIFSNI